MEPLKIGFIYSTNIPSIHFANEYEKRATCCCHRIQLSLDFVPPKYETKLPIHCYRRFTA